MRLKISLLFVCLFWACFNASVNGQVGKKSVNVDGKWNSTAELPDGSSVSSVLHLKLADRKLTAQFESERGTMDTTKASLVGDKLTLVFPYNTGQNEMEITIKAIVAGDQINGEWSSTSGTAEADVSGKWKATRIHDFVPLFDGESFDLFRGYNEEKIGPGWMIEDGTIKFAGKVDGKRSGDLVTRKAYSDFDLRFEWKMTPGGNSGVMYRVSLGDKRPWFTGPEYQLLDDDVHKDGKDATRSTGSLYAMYKPIDKKLKPVGEWNESRIVLKGDMIQHWLNGRKVVEAQIGSEDWNRRFEASKFKTKTGFGKNKTGHIVFQDHGNPFWLRNLRIKEL